MKNLITRIVLGLILATAPIAITGVLTGCAIRGSSYVVHPGAVNALDSKTYDALLFVKGVLNEWDANPAPPEPLGPAIGVLRSVHASAYADWILYREAVKSGEMAASQEASMRASTAEMSTALSAFQAEKKQAAIDPSGAAQ